MVHALEKPCPLVEIDPDEPVQCDGMPATMKGGTKWNGAQLCTAGESGMYLLRRWHLNDNQWSTSKGEKGEGTLQTMGTVVARGTNASETITGLNGCVGTGEREERRLNQ